ncbi:MAG: cell division protein ZipA C-terminal FtsZ-binding domain-containing protein [Methylococcales bacterium]|nr:cell division protein ZipA C-terminal FtsZ-binding domain-containing protein [Methylococcales bacterium]
MDKELLRIVIIATGLIIIMGMLTWSYLKNKKFREDLDFYDDTEFKGQPENPLALDDDKTDSEPAEAVDHHYYDQEDAIYEPEEDDDIEPPQRVAAPAIIQFSLIAKADEGFNGIDLANAFGIVGLEYGNLKIYERLDANRLVDYGVACMVEPGTFPDSNLDAFYCPGLVFFMQPGALDDAQTVFDDYIETIQILAVELDGMIMDQHRQPLTDAAIQSLRQSL